MTDSDSHPDSTADRSDSAHFDATPPFGTAPSHREHSTIGEARLNPWFLIWIRPRATIRQIIDTDPRRLVLVLAAVAGIGQTLDQYSAKDAGDKLSMESIFSLAVFGGSIAGIVSLYIGAALLQSTGRWLGGVANQEQLRAAIAWGSIPSIWRMLLWIPELALIGSEMFTSQTPRLDASANLAAAFMGLMVVEMVLVIWQFVVLLKCVGEVHGFSAWKALGASLLAILILIGAVFGIVIILTLAFAALTGA